MKKSFLRGKRVLLLSSAIISGSLLVGIDCSFAQDAKDNGVIVVKGTRASIQSSINRKKRAGTVVDSIVAEDVGKFPDKNVGEALSRISGVQLTRDFGEGTKVSIRGVEPDLNRIEIDGASVISAGQGGGRSASLNDLPAELISSIDVFKGFTADMVEGGIGGTVSIKTRKPLDFKKPTLVATASGQYQTTDGTTTPRYSVLATKKFLDDRLGLMANVTYDHVITRNDYARNTYWIFNRDWDFSPDKTRVSTNPAAAAVTTVAGCAAITDATTKTACQQQWYDYSPQIPRYGIWWRDNTRKSAEFTADYKLNDKSRVWVSYQKVMQDNEVHDRNYAVDFATPANRLRDQLTLPTYNATTGVPTGGTCSNASTTSTPAGIVVSADHRVTQFTVGNCLSVAANGGQALLSSQSRDFNQKVDTNFVSTGYIYKGDRLNADISVYHTDSGYFDSTNSAAFAYNVPGMTVKIDDSNIPHFIFPSGVDASNLSKNIVSAALQYRPNETLNYENQAKLDFTYRVDKFKFSTIQFGARFNEYNSKVYAGGGYTADYGTNLASTADDIIVPTANVNQTATFDPLNKTGVVRAPDTQTYTNVNWYSGYVNAATIAQMYNSSVTTTPGGFFDGYSGVDGLPSGWAAPDFRQLAQYFDTSHFNHDNVRVATANNGKSYAQLPSYVLDEKTQAAYVRGNFSFDFMGLDFDGNLGLRYVKTQDASSGTITISEYTKSACTGDLSAYGGSSDACITANPSSAWTTVVKSVSLTTMNKEYSDLLPSFNIATWLKPNILVARFGYSKVMARPKPTDMRPTIACTIGSGSRNLAAGVSPDEDDCKGGNPYLDPYRATDYDLSFEYYPNRDTQVSLGLFYKDIQSFILTATPRTIDLFQNGTNYDVTMPVNGRGAKTKGIEATYRTAFTFLPGVLSGLGVDLNYTWMTADTDSVALYNALDGSMLPYPGLSENSYNVTLWYDKGPLNARLAYNYRDDYYTGANDVSGNPSFRKATGYLDAKVSYDLNERTEISIEGKNLTNQAEYAYSGLENLMTELAYPGRRYYMGITWKF